MDCESSDQSQSLIGRRSESKILVRLKRGIAEVEESSEISLKRMKLRDLESVFGCEDDNPYGESKDNHPKSGPFSLDLNTEDISGLANDPFFPIKSCENSKLRDDLGCGSLVGPPDRMGSMRVWDGLKLNNYMSSSHSTLPTSVTVPKPRGKKKANNDVMKKKMEKVKKEQVGRFARVAAPSGLLNGLNPGIINHVRNSKQVHSIIEAFVRSGKEVDWHIGSRKFVQAANSSGVDTVGCSKGEDDMMGKMHISDYHLFSKTGFQNTETSQRDEDSYARTFMTFQNEDDKLKGKLSFSVTVASENNSSSNVGSVNLLSYKAAIVSYQ